MAGNADCAEVAVVGVLVGVVNGCCWAKPMGMQLKAAQMATKASGLRAADDWRMVWRVCLEKNTVVVLLLGNRLQLRAMRWAYAICYIALMVAM